MEFQKVLETRRSIRKYDGSKKVTKEQMEEIIRAGLLAPSWKNSETARYYAAISEEGIAKVRSLLPDFNQNNTVGAAYIVETVVANRAGCDREGNPITEFAHNQWGIYDRGAATENMILKATDMGLGTLIMGIRDSKGLKEAFDIPDTEIVVAVVAVGYPAIEPEMPRRRALEDVAKFF